MGPGWALNNYKTHAEIKRELLNQNAKMNKN
jgi:hypothetical protein